MVIIPYRATSTGAPRTPMPAKQATEKPRPAQETWRDPPWTHPNEAPQFNLLTREQLIERVRENGYEASARDLIFWESEGVLPRAVKQRHDGATRALYPHW